MQQEATRDDVQLFAQAVKHLGYRRNVSTGRTVPLPPNADDTVATYKHRDTGRRVCVWPVTTDEQVARVGAVADCHGFTFVQFGRPEVRKDGLHPHYNDRCAAGHFKQPGDICRICIAATQARADAGRTPLQVDADAKPARLRTLALEAANNAAAAITRDAAHMYHEDAEALSYGAACVEAQSRRRA
ncbi:MAG: hypothetical protein U5L06_00770 [Rhodovibrio sp.]|nr:hypothetical protein [Rhodovibrio sp.]